jgi:hypothetical protein
VNDFYLPAIMLDNEQTCSLVSEPWWNGRVRFSKERKGVEDDEMTWPSGNDENC